ALILWYGFGLDPLGIGSPDAGQEAPSQIAQNVSPGKGGDNQAVNEHTEKDKDNPATPTEPLHDEPDPVVDVPNSPTPVPTATSDDQAPSNPSSPLDGVVSLTFESPTRGTIADKNGLGTGFTHRMPGTGGSWPGNDPNMDLLSRPGRLLLTSTRSGISMGGSNLANMVAPGILLEGIGGQDFSISAKFYNVQTNQASDILVFFVGTSVNKHIIAGFHSPNQIIFGGHTGEGTFPFEQTQAGHPGFIPGDDILLTLSRQQGEWSLAWKDLTIPSASGSLTEVSIPWLDDQPDLYMGILHADGGNSIPQTADIDDFTVVVAPGVLPPEPGNDAQVQTPPGRHGEVDTRLPVPDEESQQKALTLIKELFQPDFVQAKTLDEKSEVAKKILKLAEGTQDEPTERYVLLRVARDVATQSGDADTTTSAIDRLVTEYQVDAVAMQEKSLTKLSKATMSREKRSGLAKLMFSAASDAYRQERYDTAIALLDLAQKTARRAGDMELVRELEQGLRTARHARQEFLDDKQALKTLEDDPDDPDANLLAGKYYCYALGDWNGGLSMLAKGSDADLAAVAKRELAGTADAEDTASLGHAWWDIAQTREGQEQEQILAHAFGLYRAALPDLSGLGKMKAERRLAEAPKALPEIPESALPAGTVVAFSFEKDTFFERNGKRYVRDVSGSGVFGLVSGTQSVPGPKGQALLFDGDDLVSFPDSRLPSGNSPRTVCFWVQTSTTRVIKICLSYGGLPSNDCTYLLLFGTADPGGRGGRATKMTVANPGGSNERSGATTVTDGKWHHVALVYGGNNEAILYIDGVVDLRFPKSYRTSLPGTAFIGGYNGGSSFKGSIDDVLIIARALSPAEIGSVRSLTLKSHASREAISLPSRTKLRLSTKGRVQQPVPALPKGTVLALSFEKNNFFEKDGKQYVRDLSGQENHGELRNVTTARGKFGQCLRFQGKADVLCTDKGFPMGNAPRTVCLWFKTGDET
ncbi:hypothetical protein LCGC14_1717630, partial [marine sediment metagenome]